MTVVTEFNSIAELETLEPAWNALLRETSRADFFRTLDWLRVYWKHFGEQQQLRVLAVEQAGRVTGILPLAVRRHETPVGVFRALVFPMDYWGSLYGPIGPDPNEIIRHGMRHIAATERDWDYIELGWLHGSSHEHLQARHAMAEASFRSSPSMHTEVPIVDMRTTWDEYWSSRSGSWRSNCRRNAKKLTKAGHVEYLRYRPNGSVHGDDNPCWELYTQCERIAEVSWQGSSATGTTMTHGTVREFLRDVHVAAARAGCLDMNLLFVGGNAVAFNYNYVYCGYVSSLRLGFDPQFRGHGAGTVLTYRMLSDCFERGDHTFDFLPGSLEAKQNWRTSVESTFRCSHFPLGFGRLELLRLKRWLRDRWRTVRSVANKGAAESLEDKPGVTTEVTAN
jgi:CelD/BcsL family acetyltransferase involved in cellulose biosynthesis